MDIKRMKKNPNPGLFFSFFYFCEGGGGRALQGKGRCVGKGVGATIFICDPLYQPNTHCFTFS